MYHDNRTFVDHTQKLKGFIAVNRYQGSKTTNNTVNGGDGSLQSLPRNEDYSSGPQGSHYLSSIERGICWRPTAASGSWWGIVFFD